MQDGRDHSGDAKPAVTRDGSRAADRVARQKAALKANMARRKSQARAREAGQDNGAADDPGTKDD